VPCPRCKTLNEWGSQKCARCQTWVVVQCVFCNSLSPHHVPACLTCNEAFLGAPERLAERQREASMRRGFEVATAVAGVAAPFLGALAGSALAGSRSYHSDDESSCGGGMFTQTLSSGDDHDEDDDDDDDEDDDEGDDSDGESEGGDYGGDSDP
jgi:hypothetical protein